MKRNGTRSLAAILAMAGLAAGCGGDSVQQPRLAQGATVPQGATALTAKDYYTVVQQIYVSYFGRPADVGGLQYWAERMLAANGPTTLTDLYAAYNTNAGVREIVNAFALSKESQDLYAGDNSAFIEAVYQNLFSRSADAGGKAYWADLIDRGILTRSAAAINLAAGARDTDTTIINNKTSAASTFTSTLTNGLRQSSYSGLTANQVVRTMLRTVTLSTNYSAGITSTVDTLVNTYRGAAKAEGAYEGTLKASTSTAFKALILENAEFWGMYGKQVNNTFYVDGFVQGKGSYGANNVFSATSLRDYGYTPAAQMSMTSVYGAGTTINGQVNSPMGTVTFSGTQDPDFTYQYDTATNYSVLGGQWSMKDSDDAPYAVTFYNDGTFYGISNACTFSGKLTPRASGKNVFDASATLGAKCDNPNAKVYGIALSYPIGGTNLRQLIMAGITSDATTGWVVFGSR